MDKRNKKSKVRSQVLKHFKGIGFTNRLALYIVLFLVIGLVGGFILAWRSISYGYTGALACWSVCFTPIGSVAGIVLGKVVDKSKAENTSADGDGIKYVIAKASGFVQDGNINSPAI